ncbi:MAG: DUF4339 domain-containing protein [Treponema sp.]|nr:DUF4339 domain-containing protein [Treponema sp.]MEE3434524.1 DUF4339 domain-containing protein [Treponema sp.]
MQNNKDSFFSMDRLVEFGMGMALSQQIVQNMNNMMASMRQPPLAQGLCQPFGMQAAPGAGANGQPMFQTYAGQGTPPAQSASAAQANAGAQPLLPEVFYISRESGKSEGPYSGTEIARLVVEKKVTAQTWVWKTGMAEWKAAADFPDLLAIIALVPPETPSGQ